MNKLDGLKLHGLLTFVSALLFIPFLGSVPLFDWDEINFAEAAREMVVSGNWSKVQINFQPFWEKPPFFFWLQAICMKLFGVNEFAARFPNAVCGIITLNLIFYLGRRYFSEKLALLWVLFYLGSFTPFFYFKSGIIDPWFNLFIFTAIIFIFIASRNKFRSNYYWFGAGVLMGLAIITKGPVALVIASIVCFVFLILNNFRPFFSVLNILNLVFGILLIPALWFVPETLSNGTWFVRNFLAYQAELLTSPVASHGQPWFYHPLVLLMGCFPASVFALSKLGPSRGYTAVQADLFRWMKILFWVVLILFSFVTTKIVHYSSLCYLPLTFIAALTVYDWDKGFVKPGLKVFQKVLLILIPFIWLTILFALPLFGFNDDLKDKIISLSHDPFAVENMKVNVKWGWWHFIPFVWFLLAWVIYYFRLFLRRTFIISVKQLLSLHALGIFLLMLLIVPQVEKYSQQAAIEFFENTKSNGAVYIPFRYKTYAPYFYAKVTPYELNVQEKQAEKRILAGMNATKRSDLTLKQIEVFEEQWKQFYLTEPSKRKVYVVCLKPKEPEMSKNELFNKIGEKGGFVFFEN